MEIDNPLPDNQMRRAATAESLVVAHAARIWWRIAALDFLRWRPKRVRQDFIQF